MKARDLSVDVRGKLNERPRTTALMPLCTGIGGGVIMRGPSPSLE